MMNLIENKLGNISVTENGAVGYKTSNYALLDLNYQVSSLRDADEETIIKLFDDAFHENKEYAVKWLFFARDVREGLGERRLFRICYRRLVELDIDIFYKNLLIISEYGRWDDLISLIGISEVTDKKISEIIDYQIAQDLGNILRNKSISLIGKWLPSENASSKKTKALGKQVRKLLSLSPREYRLLLTKLRKYIDVVEVKMCDNKWENIDYSKVPSLANLKYKNAFLKHDGTRRTEFLESVKKGKLNFNMKVATPVDIVSKYTNRWYGLRDYDDTLELGWLNLKDVLVSYTLVVADGSGSMFTEVSGNTKAIDVANALAIYTAEHNSGVYKNKYITFSHRPQFVDLSEAKSLKEKLQIAYEHDEISNTNIEAVFDLILDIAVENKIPQNHMVDNILIISDMEFDEAQTGWYRKSSSLLTKPLFKSISERYREAGYKLPKLIFWNVNSRTKTIPLIENELGVTLLSGFSQNALKMVMSDKYDPYEVLVETITAKRYDKVKV